MMNECARQEGEVMDEDNLGPRHAHLFLEYRQVPLVPDVVCVAAESRRVFKCPCMLQRGRIEDDVSRSVPKCPQVARVKVGVPKPRRECGAQLSRVVLVREVRSAPIEVIQEGGVVT